MLGRQDAVGRPYRVSPEVRDDRFPVNGVGNGPPHRERETGRFQVQRDVLVGGAGCIGDLYVLFPA